MTDVLRGVVAGAVLVAGVAFTSSAMADTVAGDTPFISTQNQRVVIGERYVPTIWVDPDGCEHWVMDDGFEGYMTPHVNRQGIPVCRRGNVCGVMNSDQFFATDSYHIGREGQAGLQDFFKNSTATAFVIAGHTDSRASDDYNMKLSYNRAVSVARVARSVGARVVDVRGYGERMPIASNKTRDGKARNRRVEILCIK
ncbi:OmpA family protein [Primorskyibacter sp. S187A]|uniref:OmpA family protein n=1 Tax=Primorskyibacter sp. S187A TaxID=3415130 RepID=UPI003C79980F